MPANYRLAAGADLPSIAALLAQYMHETYQRPWPGSVDHLQRDGTGAHFRLTIAESDAAVVGFAAWRDTYDLHHCAPGIEVIDMFVQPAHRGRGIGASLLARVAAQSAEAGAVFMMGGAVDTGSARLYDRATVRHGCQSYLGGRAFRAFAALAGVSPRRLLVELPPRDWNLEP